MGGMEHELKVGLLGPGGWSNGRPWPLGLYHHDGRLCHPRQAQPLHHEAETPARGGRHGPYPCEGGAKGHGNGRYLILRLLHDYVPLPGLPCQVGHYPRRGGHGVGAHKLTACGKRPQGQGLIASYQHTTPVVQGFKLPGELGGAVPCSEVITGPGGLDVILCHSAFLSEEVSEYLRQGLKGVTQEAQGRPCRHGIAVQLVPTLLGQPVQGDTQEVLMGLYLYLLTIVNNYSPLMEFTLVEVYGLLVEGDEDIYATGHGKDRGFPYP